jgi:hypothetical protein
MEYINTGAYIGTARAASKAALIRAMRADPTGVRFDRTAAVLDEGGAELSGAEIPAGVRLSVVGPDPYNNRKWYATVELTARGVRVT